MIRYFTRHPTIANLTMVLIIAVGVIALPHLLRETFPRIAPHEVEVTVAHPGATPETVSRAICTSVEDALDGLRRLAELRCDAFENRAVAVVTMRAGGDFARFTSDVEAAIQSIHDFPETAEAPAIRQLGREDLVAVVALTAAGQHDMTELRALAEDIKTRMLRWGGIPKVEVAGFSDPELRIEINEMSVRELGLSLEEVAKEIGRLNADIPLGEINASAGTNVLRFADERRSADAYRGLIIASSANGGQVRLMDVARIFETVSDPEVAIELNGQPAAILRIKKEDTHDTLRVMAALRAFTADENSRLPPGAALTITGDTADVLSDRLQMLTKNSAQGLVLVFAVMWLFFGFRQAFWITAGLPVSFFGALAAMALLGYSINMLTLVALLIVIGILMDDALVIAENIETKRSKGMPPAEAAIAGAYEVAPGVLASFITTAAVFGSLAFLHGDLGETLRVVPIVMLLVLTVSLVEAFLILPAHLSHGVPGSAQRPRIADRLLTLTRRHVVGPVARAAVAWRWLTLGVMLLVFFASLAAIMDGRLKFQAFPELDGDQIEARLAMTAGSSVEETRAAMNHVLGGLERVNSQLSPRNPAGAPLVRDVILTFGENADVGGTGPHLATARIDLLGVETRGSSLDEILALWRRQAPLTPGVQRLSLTEGVQGPAGRAVEFHLAHDDLRVLAKPSSGLRDWLGRYAGVHNISDDMLEGRPEVRIKLRDTAHTLGLGAQDVANQVRAGFQGAKALSVQTEEDAWDVSVRLAESARRTIGDIETFSIKTPAGNWMPLDTVAELTQERGVAAMRRLNGRLTVSVAADVDTSVGNADEIVRDTMRSFLPKLQAAFPQLTVYVQGANAAAEQTQSSMATGLAIGMLIIFMVLSIQLRSYVEPLVVMAIIPFAFSGAVAGHLALGIDLSMPSLLGFASLTGIVVNDSILLMHAIKLGRSKGQTAAEAAENAALARFRAILLTSITTVAGTTPLLFETSLQAQPLVPMVASIAFGLTTTTVLLLLVVPAFYAALDDLGVVAPCCGSDDLTFDPIPAERA